MSERWFGILNINKPRGLTSRRVVDHVVKLVRPAKVGHAGTLDPLATGVLVVCVGRATRLMELVQQQAKEYRARFILGKRSDTDDVDGNVTDVMDAPPVTRSDIEAALPRFVGRISQVPPQYSAVHVQGRRAYQLARAGHDVEIEPRDVDVYRLELVEFAYPEFALDIECGSGTYVRSIGRDLGSLLRSGAVMSELVRTRVGVFRFDDAVTLEELTAESIAKHLRPATAALGDIPRIQCSETDLAHIRSGRTVRPGAGTPIDDGTQIAVIAPDGTLACLAEYRRDDGLLAPKHVFLA